jgi:hypothetical protein
MVHIQVPVYCLLDELARVAGLFVVLELVVEKFSFE